MAEKWTLSTPVARSARADYTLRFVFFDWENKVATIGWRDNTGLAKEHRYTDPTIAEAIMRGINKSNNAIKTMQVRAFERLVADGIIEPGTATGTPD